jgi:hypothetical protein
MTPSTAQRIAAQAPVAAAPVSRAQAVVRHLPGHPRALMHPGVYKIALLCWAGFLSVFWITFWVSGNALFMVTVGTFYALMFFGVPITMSRMAPTRPREGSLDAFLRGRFGTFTGPVTGLEALVQVILVPLFLGLGGVAIGTIIRLSRM